MMLFSQKAAVPSGTDTRLMNPGIIDGTSTGTVQVHAPWRLASQPFDLVSFGQTAW
jgi:predicted metalloenzyme YecM